VTILLGVDGGGTKTNFLLIDAEGRILARRREGPAYHLETGLDALRAMLERGIHAVLDAASVAPSALGFAFIGLPAYGEDSRIQESLDAIAAPALPQARFRCGNDMVCGWAGALAGGDGINIVAGTGSIAYGEFAGRRARAGGWGELFSDEGSAYWVAREGLRLFSRMSDGRTERGPLHELIRAQFELSEDLDLCAAIYSTDGVDRSRFAQLAPTVARAAGEGDQAAAQVFATAAEELAQIVHAVRDRLAVPAEVAIPLSYSGGMFAFGDLVLAPLRAALGRGSRNYRFVEPQLPPDAGAALYAARLNGTPLTGAAIDALKRQLGTGT